MDARIDFVQEEALRLQWSTKIRAIYVVEDVSICLVIRTLEFRAVWQHLPPLPESMLMRRQLPVHQRHEVLHCHPLLFAAVI